jgi:putative transposase
MSRKALVIQTSSRIEKLIHQELNRRQLEGHYIQRFRIIAHCLMAKQNIEIAVILGCHDKTVRKWRKRFWQHQEALEEFEKGHVSKPLTDKELLDKVKEILSDSPRTGSPARISETDIDRLIALACEHPEKYGLPYTHWTHKELAKQAAKMGIQLSSVHLGRILKKRLAPTQK